MMSTHVFKMNLRYDKPWEIRLCISVNIYHRLLKLTINTQFFKISLCHHKKWEIKLCISVNICCTLQKLGMGAHFFKISHAIIQNGK